jgi:hypothetical protein
MARYQVMRPPLVAYTLPSCYHGTREASKGVAHTTEGLGTVETYGEFFKRTPDKLASTFLVERTGRAGIYVAQLNIKTYHVANHNSECYGIEQVGFASTSRKDWLTKYKRQIYMTAWIFAWANQGFKDPIAMHSTGSDRTGRHFIFVEGLTQHKWVPDNDHDDCGPGYPWDVVTELADKWAKRGAPTPGTRLLIRTGHRPT